MNKIGLYLHVPFCLRKCAYCDFYSVPESEKIPAYLASLRRHFAFWSEKTEGCSADTLYVGGGTPSLLKKEDWEELFSALRASFSLEENAEITAEMNPETLDPEKIAAFLRCGGSRLSLGMQSASDAELKQIGRGHTFSDVANAVRTAREKGVKNLSLDLIYALPFQTAASFRTSLEKAVALSPEHLSLYCLTVDPRTPIARFSGDLPDEETQREMYLSSVDFLRQNGYAQYEISNFARPGFESRHNLKYWRRKAYLGIGPGAHSFFENARFSYPPDLDGFLREPSPERLLSPREALSFEEEEEEKIILPLRLAEGIDLSALSPASRKRVGEKLSVLSLHGLCRKTEKGFALTPEGFFVSNAILSDLI